MAFGLTEVLNYPFIGPADLDRCEIPSDDPRRNLVVLANPLSDEQPGIRTTLLPGLLNAAKRNAARGADSIAVFETGAVAFPLAGARRYHRGFPSIVGLQTPNSMSSCLRCRHSVGTRRCLGRSN